MISHDVDIPTTDGLMNTTFHAPGTGPAPLILFYMDAPGIRQELHDMAHRIAAAGFHVALPNLYYRTDRAVDFPSAELQRNPSVMQAMLGKMRSLTPEGVSRDTDALMAFADTSFGTAGTQMGAIGYCMSGRWAIQAAAQHPARFAAAASFYGTGLVTDQTDSPHLLAARIAGELYVGAAENDALVPLGQIETFRKFLAATEVKHRVEIYPGTGHGFAFDRGHFAPAAAARHWDVLLDLFARTLPANPQ